jgi:hypothetical protein
MRSLIVAAFVLLAAASMAPADQSDPNRNCDLPAPSRNAGLNGNHGVYLFVFPADVPADYTGCQMVWDELGRQYMLLRYVDGDLSYMAFDPTNAFSEKSECFYEDRKLSNGDKACPAYTDAERGFGSLPDDAMKIPPERDLRLKSDVYGTP